MCNCSKIRMPDRQRCLSVMPSAPTHGHKQTAYLLNHITVGRKCAHTLKKMGSLWVKKTFFLECIQDLIFACLGPQWAQICPPLPVWPNFQPSGPPAIPPNSFSFLETPKFRFSYLEASVELEAETFTNRFRAKN